MSKIWAVIKREYISHVRTKTFIISTVLGPVFMLVITVLPVVLALSGGGEKSTLAVVDGSGEVQADFAGALAAFKVKDGTAKYTIVPVAPAADLEAQKAGLGRNVMGGTYTGYVYIPPDVLTGGTAEYASRQTSDFDAIETLNRALTGVSAPPTPVPPSGSANILHVPHLARSQFGIKDDVSSGRSVYQRAPDFKLHVPIYPASSQRRHGRTLGVVHPGETRQLLGQR